ncbi:hypothetical protein SUGI_0567400 [Cryptomeria japonica]|uniref:uncharacterized protein LOC131036384 isoform X2 n=1 Tax=Cryptomeria japonica TaxID=3369 RepID=UPI002408D5B6|nr:uncharacterized protein LOC131036384 isoform X2 [Cryptomeria japonica]GLJ28777.1 hypothetical protein SUGI_0567400 [Cryptomeria japonica]
MAYYTMLLALIFMSSFIKATESSLVLEDGYTVDTVLDGHKLDIYPYAIMPRENDIILLDSLNSSFLRMSLPLSPHNVVELFSGSGNGMSGLADGDLTKAKFKHPKSFTSDAKGNIYVADHANFVIRKISKSGVSTIAGGKAVRSGHSDGPSQEATFSSDFDVTFVPSICALLVSDRGNKMIRQIKLPPSECIQNSGSGTHWMIPVTASLVSFLLGLIVMFFLQPYIMARAGSVFQYQNQMQTSSLMSMAKQVPICCCIILSAIVSTCYLMYSAIFVGRRTQHFKPQQTYQKSVCLLDNDISPEKLPSEMKPVSNLPEDLINLDSNLESSIVGILDSSEQKIVVEKSILKPTSKNLEEHMHANISAFQSGESMIARRNTRMAGERTVQGRF